MNRTKSLIFLAIGICILLIFSFKYPDTSKSKLSNDQDYEYAILYFKTSGPHIEIYYDNGVFEDYIKLKNINRDDFNKNKSYDKYLIESFKYLNQQGYELKSFSVYNLDEALIRFQKEYIFVSKKQ